MGAEASGLGDTARPKPRQTRAATDGKGLAISCSFRPSKLSQIAWYKKSRAGH
jgi:hypothetical protein